MSQSSRSRLSAGFTLIEVLIIAPIVVLVIGGFVALMMAMVGDVLLTRDQNVMAYEIQDALDRIEQDTRIGTQFLDTSRTLTAPQGSDDGVAAFSSSNALIMGALATNKNPTAADRQLVYYANQPSACGSATEAQNRVFINKIIYYIKNGSLWRRVIVPPYNTNSPADSLTLCAAPWQQNTCTSGYTLVPPCQTNDSEVMKNIKTMAVKYYNSPSGNTEVTGADILTASTIDVTLTGEKTTSGKVASSSGSVRASKLNSINADIPPPTSPTVSQLIVNSPDLGASFSWSTVPYATSYNLSYKINAGSWSADIPVSAATTTYPVTGNRGDTIAFRVSSVNSSGESPDASTEVTLPNWIDLDLQNNWVEYGSVYNTAQYTKSSSGVVFLKGLVRFGTDTANAVYATLPPGYRPSQTLVYQVATSPNAGARIDIASDGSIRFQTGDASWMSLDGISFLPSTAPNTWSSLASTYVNGWSDWNAGFTPLRVTTDSMSRVHLQGLAKAGTTTAATTMASLDPISTSYRPPTALFYSAGGAGYSNFSINTGGVITKQGAQTSSYMGLQAMYYPGTTGSWNNLTTLNSWVTYNTGFPTLQYTKSADNVVTIRGMIKNGSTASGTVIATLPAGARPQGRSVFTVNSNYLFGRIDIETDGDILVQTVSNLWLAINLSYIVD